jgi:hypothetical protein
MTEISSRIAPAGLQSTTLILSDSIYTLGKSMGLFLSGKIHGYYGPQWFWLVFSWIILAGSAILFII